VVCDGEDKTGLEMDLTELIYTCIYAYMYRIHIFRGKMQQSLSWELLVPFGERLGVSGILKSCHRGPCSRMPSCRS